MHDPFPAEVPDDRPRVPAQGDPTDPDAVLDPIGPPLRHSPQARSAHPSQGQGHRPTSAPSSDAPGGWPSQAPRARRSPIPTERASDPRILGPVPAPPVREPHDDASRYRRAARPVPSTSDPVIGEDDAFS